MASIARPTYSVKSFVVPWAAACLVLTAISTVLGFIPIAADVFWGPMAFAIMGGLFVATILTLIVLPALYVALFRIKEPAQEAAVADTPGLEVQR